MALVYKNSSTLSFDDFIRDLDTALRMSAATFRVSFDTSSRTSLLNQTSSIYGAELHPGEHSDDLTLRFISRIEERQTWCRIPDTNTTPDQARHPKELCPSMTGAPVCSLIQTRKVLGPAL